MTIAICQQIINTLQYGIYSLAFLCVIRVIKAVIYGTVVDIGTPTDFIYVAILAVIGPILYPAIFLA